MTTYQPDNISNRKPLISSQPETLVVGAIAVDSISKLEPNHHPQDSNPGETKTSIGGVAHNVALASHYGGGLSKLVLIIGSDQKGAMIQTTMEMDKSGLLTKDGHETASYTSIHSLDGELIIACSDMKIVEQDISDHIIKQISEDTKALVFDCNLSVATINKVLDHVRSTDIKTIIEPTSFAKSRKISQLKYPVDLITPTANEIDAIYDAMEANDRFDDEWFEYIDLLKLDDFQRFNLKPIYQELTKIGLIQKAFRILPFSSNILIKLGKKGVLSLGSTANNIFQAAKTKSPFHLETSNFYIDYYPIPKESENLQIINVTGAGDSLLGYLIGHMDQPKDILINNCQRASGFSISHPNAISPEISKIK